MAEQTHRSPAMMTSRFALIATALATTLTLLATPAAEARERQKTVTGNNGKTATRDVSRQRGDVSSTATGPNGGSSSRSVERSADGTEATVTGPKGKTLTRKRTKTDDGSSTTVSGSGGKSATVERTRQP
jgi:hypothetical protein